MEKKEVEQESVPERIIKGFSDCLAMFPDSVKFLGEDITYPRPKKRFFGKKTPDLTELRAEVQKFSEREGVTNSREMINK